MATNFPNSPSVNDIFTTNAKTWKWDGTSWRSVGVQIGGGSMEFVAEAEITGAAATTLTLNGLDLNAAERYFIEIEVLGASGTPTLALTYNADTTATNYDVQVFESAGGSSASARANNGILLTTVATDTTSIEGWLRISAENTPRFMYHYVSGDATSVKNGSGVHTWRTPSTNITSLTLTSSVSSALGIGSRVKVWKLATVASGTVTTAPVVIRKLANQSRTSTTVIADDDELFTTLAANSTYEFEIAMFYIVANAPGLRWSPNFTGTISSTRWRSEQQHNNNANYGVISTVFYCGAYNVMPAATVPGWSNGFGPYAGSTVIRGTIVVGATGGKFSLQWAQSASSGTAATIDAGSYMRVQKIG